MSGDLDIVGVVDYTISFVQHLNIEFWSPPSPFELPVPQYDSGHDTKNREIDACHDSCDRFTKSLLIKEQSFAPFLEPDHAGFLVVVLFHGKKETTRPRTVREGSLDVSSRGKKFRRKERLNPPN